MAQRKAGRPPIEDETQRRDKKVQLSFTQSEYDYFEKMQGLLNQSTLAATLMLFIDKGVDAYQQEFTRGM
jgi:hypothetical protein